MDPRREASLDREHAIISTVRSKRQRNISFAQADVPRRHFPHERTAGCGAAPYTGSVAQERDGHHVDEVTSINVLEASFNPRIEDADPDSSPPPKDRNLITSWMNFYCFLRKWNPEESEVKIGSC